MGASRLEQEAMRSKQKKGYGYASKTFLGEKHSCSPGETSRANKQTGVGLC